MNKAAIAEIVIPRLFNYSGSFEADANANAYLALYGWTTNPLVEYYVIESMGVHNPSDNASATLYGMLDSDGGTYEIWQKQRTDAPSIIGTATFQQYWSIRTKMHCGGTITTGNHFQAWEAAGLPLGDQTSMVLAVEGQAGGGSANLTVGVLPTISPLETPTSTQRTETHHYSTHYTTTPMTSTHTTSTYGTTTTPVISSHTTSTHSTTTTPVTSTHSTTAHTTSTSSHHHYPPRNAVKAAAP